MANTTQSTGTLLAEWTSAKVPYRLIGVGKFSSGYEDSYVIEKRELDALGEPRWTTFQVFTKNDAPTLLVLADGLKQLHAEVVKLRAYEVVADNLQPLRPFRRTGPDRIK